MIIVIDTEITRSNPELANVISIGAIGMEVNGNGHQDVEAGRQYIEVDP